ncbi:T9SS type A sorting domain-containing protein [Dyadobacter endophyticus]|uniref:T9SS type A sorting domain-containing protein n=1 Tax=Dyadobacter endophyticus TaxID=1749036 RepID=UPI003CFB29F0
MKTALLILIVFIVPLTSHAFGTITYARALEPTSGVAFPNPNAPTVYAGQSIRLSGFAGGPGGISPFFWFGEGLPTAGGDRESLVTLQNSGIEPRTVIYIFAEDASSEYKAVVTVTVLPAQTVSPEPVLTGLPICAGKYVPITITSSGCPGTIKWYYIKQQGNYQIKSYMPEYNGLTALVLSPMTTPRSICATCTVGGIESLGGKRFTIYPNGVSGSLEIIAQTDPSVPRCPWTKVNFTATGVGIDAGSVKWSKTASGVPQTVGTGASISSTVNDRNTSFSARYEDGCSTQNVFIDYKVNLPTAIAATSSSQTFVFPNSLYASVSKDCQQIAYFSTLDNFEDFFSKKEITVKVNVEPQIGVYKGQPYLQRHYDFEPVQAIAPTAKYQVGLYFTQAEFDAFNEHSSVKLPSNNSTEELEKFSNLRVWQAHGLPLSQPATPGNYSGGAVTDYLADTETKVIWDNELDCWRISFWTSGFSGFFITMDNAIAFPVTLVDFSARLNEKVVDLNWQTSDEVNSDHFEVQHGTDGKNWATLHKISSAGTSNTAKKYSYRHENPVHGENLYRLKMVDSDETYTYSKIVSVNFTSPGGLRIFPNPAFDQIVFQNEVPLRNYQILSVTGKVVQENRFENASKSEADISSLAVGVYIVKVTDIHGESTNRKFVIKR